jgi:flagellar motor switch protein FliG
VTVARGNQLGNKQKAAVLMIALGPEASGKICQYMPEEDVEQLMIEVARLGTVSHNDRCAIIAEFRELCLAQEVISEGGIQHAKKFLEAAFGPEKAGTMVSRVVSALQVLPFDFIKKTDPAQLVSFIQEEHPQTIALILAHLQPQQAAAVLSGLPQEVRGEVARRMAIMDRTPPEVVREIERVLQTKASSVVTQSFTAVGGVKSLVDVINCVDRQTEKMILESLTENSPEIAEEVKKMMFVFEDITTLDDASIQKVLREVEIKELGLALKGVGEEVQTRIFKNMSERAANMLKEDMEFMGPVRLRAVEEAQQRVVGVIRRLEESGEIVVARGNGEELIV